MTQQAGRPKEPSQHLSEIKNGLSALKEKISDDPTLTDEQKAEYSKHVDSLMSLG